MDRKLYLPDEVAPRLRCSRRQIYDLYNEGELAGFRVGTHIKIFADSVDDFVARHSNAKLPPADPAGLDASLPTPAVRPPAPPAAGPSSRPSRGRPAPPAAGYRHLRF